MVKAFTFLGLSTGKNLFQSKRWHGLKAEKDKKNLHTYKHNILKSFYSLLSAKHMKS